MEKAMLEKRRTGGGSIRTIHPAQSQRREAHGLEMGGRIILVLMEKLGGT